MLQQADLEGKHKRPFFVCPDMRVLRVLGLLDGSGSGKGSRGDFNSSAGAGLAQLWKSIDVAAVAGLTGSISHCC